MKARLVPSALIAILLAGAVNGFPQGTFFFNNNVSTAITNVITGTRATGLTVAMYFSTDTNFPNPYTFVLNPNAVTNILAASPGIFIGGLRTVPGVPAGSYIMVQIRAWDSNYPSWEAAGGFTWCRQYVVKGQSSRFIIGPLGETNVPVLPPDLIAGLQRFTVGVSLAPELCLPLVSVTTQSNAVQLRIDSNGSSLSLTRFTIESSTALGSNSWQVRTQFSMPYSPGYPPPSTVVVWTEPQTTDLTPRFYRVRAGWPPY